jgi:hypothetical protein
MSYRTKTEAQDSVDHEPSYDGRCGSGKRGGGAQAWTLREAYLRR